ncbi:MAG: NAD(P)/FAD-dependent oxidoreductase [Rubripirellula sp.]
MAKKIVIVGGGIIGMATAWHCVKDGHDVIVVDRRRRQRDGCSFGNAGMLVPSHFIPLAAPGVIRLGLKWMLSRESPFAIRPRLSWDLLSWLWRFMQASTQQQVDLNSPLLRDLNLAGRHAFLELEQELPDGFELVKKGLLMLCASEHGLEEEVEVAQLANDLGVPAVVMNPKELADLDPTIEMGVLGGVHFPLDCHLSPNRLMSVLEKRLEELGVDFLWESRCEEFHSTANAGGATRVKSVMAAGKEIAGDEFVICGGAWSDLIAKQVGLSLPLQAGKGYSLTLDQPRQLPNICSILKEARVAVTPMAGTLRFGGTMEIVGHDESISAARLRGIIRSIPQYFPAFREDDFSRSKPWVGLRPCSPDGLPYVGRSDQHENLLIATGHGMMGISLSMITGKLIADVIEQRSSGINGLERMSPSRFQ